MLTKHVHHVGQKPTRACVVLLFKYADYKLNLSYIILSYPLIYSLFKLFQLQKLLRLVFYFNFRV
jgi:hypothetical protein